MDEMWSIINTLTPTQRVVLVGMLVGGMVNGIKRWPQVPAKWVPLASVVLAFAVSAVYFVVMNMTWEGSVDYALQALLSGTLPVAGHKMLKGVWTKMLGEESADKWLGQAHPKPEPDVATGTIVTLTVDGEALSDVVEKIGEPNVEEE